MTEDFKVPDSIPLDVQTAAVEQLSKEIVGKLHESSIILTNQNLKKQQFFEAAYGGILEGTKDAWGESVAVSLAQQMQRVFMAHTQMITGGLQAMGIQRAITALEEIADPAARIIVAQTALDMFNLAGKGNITTQEGS